MIEDDLEGNKLRSKCILNAIKVDESRWNNSRNGERVMKLTWMLGLGTCDHRQFQIEYVNEQKKTRRSLWTKQQDECIWMAASWFYH